ncbi:MAG TPA: hypothetical protein P5250_02155, partial [Bacteroidales bacterium]|nr:hypothetical protein [Bacteroidales bacterium]
NVSLEDEIKLKNYAAKKKLLLMGPDCGTAIINGVPLAFANATNKGNIGIIAASGTGLQEVSSLISEAGCGISQAIGTGSRDIKDEVGGIMFIESLKALGKDDNTKIILLISKPPHPNTLNKIINETKKINKPIIALFLGAKPDLISKTGIIYANTLEESALIAVALSKNDDCKSIQNNAYLKDLEISKLAQKLASKTKGKYLRGLYSGGTLCYEAQLILSNYIDEIYSNTPINNKFKLKNSLKSINNTVIDLGDDEFTIGKPHPMIYFSLRMKQLYEEAKNKEVGVILMDIVLGYGANLNPLNDIIPVIKKIKKIRKDLIIICPIIGTAKDPQNKNEIIHSLTNNGVIVAESNAYASKLAGNIIKLKGVEYVF